MHVAIEKTDRFKRVGHRIPGDRRLGSSRRAGYEKAHEAVDDATRLAYVEVVPYEKQATTAASYSGQGAWFNGNGINCCSIVD
jgi:hypothetical protein